jgi:hypothetical protein
MRRSRALLLHLALLCCFGPAVTTTASVPAAGVVLGAKIFGNLGRADVIALFVGGFMRGE